MILRQHNYFFLSELFLESMNSDYIAEHRCLLTKPTTITAMSKNQQKKHIPMYSKGVCSQSKLNPHKPQQRNPIVRHDLRSLSRLYWVLQIPRLPLKAIKFLALLGATKLHLRNLHDVLAEPAAWQPTLQHWENFPSTRLGVELCKGAPFCFAAVWSRQPGGAGPSEHLQGPSQAGERNLSSPRKTVQVQPVWPIPITQQDWEALLTLQHVQKPWRNWGPAVLRSVQKHEKAAPAVCRLRLTQSKPYLRQGQGARVQRELHVTTVQMLLLSSCSTAAQPDQNYISHRPRKQKATQFLSPRCLQL